jgi:hypothetical protein
MGFAAWPTQDVSPAHSFNVGALPPASDDWSHSLAADICQRGSAPEFNDHVPEPRNCAPNGFASDPDPMLVPGRTNMSRGSSAHHGASLRCDFPWRDADDVEHVIRS